MPRPTRSLVSRLAITTAAALALPLAGCGGEGGKKVDYQIPAPIQAAPPPPVKAVAIDPALQGAARDELNRALASGDADVRAHAIDALSQTTRIGEKAAY